MSAEPSKGIAIIGAGFSGLTLGWALEKQGFQVEIFESQNRPGGLIKPSAGPVLVESAAHALLANQAVEDLAYDLNVELVSAGHVSKKKWIYRSNSSKCGPRRWPLTARETLKALSWPSAPVKNQTVQAWCAQVFGADINDYLLGPALQGIYAARTEDLSASLIFGARKIKARKGRLRGSVAPLRGMPDLIQKLSSRLKIHYNQTPSLEQLQSQFKAVALAVPMQIAGEILQTKKPKLSQFLMSAPRVSITSVTLVFPDERPNLKGFGCLFPRKEGFESLGVLFNSDLFKGRVAKPGLTSETWILGGEVHRESDSEILARILRDRKRLGGWESQVEFHQVHRWPSALPLYGLELERGLEDHFGKESILQFGARVDENLYLTGNYLGALGLSKILNYNLRLAERISQDQKGNA